MYPYLRYVLVASEASVSGRLFTHNEALDVCMALGGVGRAERTRKLRELVKAEVRTSRRLKAIAYGEKRVRQFRTEVIVDRR